MIYKKEQLVSFSMDTQIYYESGIQTFSTGIILTFEDGRIYQWNLKLVKPDKVTEIAVKNITPNMISFVLDLYSVYDTEELHLKELTPDMLIEELPAEMQAGAKEVIDSINKNVLTRKKIPIQEEQETPVINVIPPIGSPFN